ncbi:hypothetical protein DCAR_0625072 [Daucus carota subsp. sativus]|uniref:Uncharacterized protein n=1 Tax=Daucus carota subsp. sativus TaxID=79200 RepID=A0A161XF15_DAUCS|nr:hypothetical protein DCAR_0625072 [Daucus carota subsp. sativus]
MKRSGVLVFAAASAAASASCDSGSSQISSSSPQKGDVCEGQKTAEEKKCCDQFSPRFDGLRFIETLVTAHR